MDYLSTSEIAKKWRISEQMVRRYCISNRIEAAVFKDGTWYIPKGSTKPKRAAAVKQDPVVNALVEYIQKQKKDKADNGIYAYIQNNMAYSSSRLASNRLTLTQVKLLYRNRKSLKGAKGIKDSDRVKICNHFCCVEYIIDHVLDPLDITFIKNIKDLLEGNSNAAKNFPCASGSIRCSDAESKADLLIFKQDTLHEIDNLMLEYEEKTEKDIDDVLNFHVRFECIRPFDDGNGRVGRLIMLKECLRQRITPFIIDDKSRHEYLMGIRKWSKRHDVLQKVANKCQKRFMLQLDYEKNMDMMRKNKYTS